MHYYKRNIGDYHKKAGRLTILQHGVYALLMDAIYDRETFPTIDEAIDWCWASTPEEIHAIEFVLGKLFTLVDGIYTQKRVAEEIENYALFCEQQAEKGKKGGRPKKPNGLNNKPSESRDKPNQSLTTNQEPLTTKDIVPTVLVDDPADTSTCPYQKIVNAYHENFPVGARVKQITAKRQKSMKARWKNGASELSFWDKYFAHAAKSQFLTGNNNRNWIADFDFFIRPDTATFMQEGKYHK